MRREDPFNTAGLIFDVDRIGPWVTARAGGTYFPGTCQGIAMVEDGEIVVGTLFDQCNGRALQMHVAAEKPLSRRFLRFCFDYPFNQLGVQKVMAPVDSANEKALRFVKAVGYVEEARVAGAGRKADLVILTMTRQQCRWIK